MKSQNHIFRTIWSEALGVWVAVSEIAKAKGKRSVSSVLRSVHIDRLRSGGDLQARLKPILFTLACCFALNAQANPIGGVVVNGQASFNTSGNTLTVTNTPGTIINWQGFSINANEVTHFAQQSASSTVLNHVVTNNPSVILGTLSSNGQVYLVNANGIMFGAGSTVDVAGLVATTLNLSDADFLAGRHNYTAVPGAQNISNAGNINAQQGGQIYLIAPNVENNGIIKAPDGEILLAAGNSVELVNSNDPNLRVKITAPAGDVTNLGQLIVGSGSLGLFGTMVRNSGIVSADSATMQGGKIVFRASQNTEVSGTVSATGTTGGNIEILGDHVALLGNASVDASGVNGGGTVLIGGDAHGTNPNIQNAQVTYVDAAATINADALHSGDGGKVVVWSDQATQFNGNISVRGGANSGNGGWVEVSGKRSLGFTGFVNTTAAHGITGSLLLDPSDITIQTTGTNNVICTGTGTATCSGVGTGSILLVSTLIAQLGAANVIVDATSGTGGTGNITVADSISSWGNNSLTLNAAGTGSITVNAIGAATGSALSIANTGAGSLSMTTAGGGINLNGTTGGGINLSGGTFSANSGAGTIVIVGTGGSAVVSTGAGGVNLTGGWIREVGGVISTTGTLTTNSTASGGTSLNGGFNTVSSFNATATGGGSVTLQNQTAGLNVTGITSTSATVHNYAGPIIVSGAVTATSVSLNGIGLINNSTITGTGAFNAVTLSAGISGFGTGTLTNTGTISNGGGANSGTVTLTGDAMALGGTITAGAGVVNLKNLTLTNAINLGSTSDIANLTLELSNAELATISTTGQVRIGSASNSGAITVSAPLTLSSNTELVNGAGGIAINGGIAAAGRNLTFDTTGTVAEAAGAGITAAGLELLGTGTYALTDAANSIGTLAGNAGSVTLVNNTALSVGAVNTVGLTATGGISLTANGVITQTAAISTPGLLSTSSIGGTNLNGANTVGSFSATNSTGGNISLTNTGALTMFGIDNTFATGSVTVNNTGSMTIMGTIAAAGGGGVNLAALGASGSITESSTGLISTSGILTTNTVTGQLLSSISPNTVGSFSATNSSSGDINLYNNASLSIAGLNQSGGGAVTITNIGDITTTGAITTNGTAATAVMLNSSGNITIGSTVTGTGGGALNLMLVHGMSGNATLASSLSLFGGNVDVQNVEGIGSGTLNVSAGTTSLTGNLFATVLGISGGTLSLDGITPTVLPTLNLSGGTLTGSGDIIIPNESATGVFNWTGGTLAGTGTFTTTAHSPCCTNNFLATNTTMNGTLTLSRVFINNGGMTQGAGPLNLSITSAGSLVNEATGTLVLGNGATGGSIIVNGVLSNLGGLAATGTGTSSVDAGGATAGTISNSGTVIVASGSTLNFLNGQTSTNTGAYMTAAGGVLNLGSSSGAPVSAVHNYSGTISNDGTLNFTGNSNNLNAGAVVTGTGTVTVPVGSVLGVAGATLSAPLVNNGTIKFSGAGNSVTGAMTQNGLLDIASGGTLATSSFTNTGTLAGGGTLELGSGTITNNGIIAPGGVGTAGILTISGNLVMGATGAVNVDISSPLPGNYDILNVTGTATLTGGTLNIVGGAEGSFDVLNAAGGFGGTKFAAINSGAYAQTSTYTANTLDVDLKLSISESELSELVENTLIVSGEEDDRKRGPHITSSDSRRGGATRADAPQMVCQ